MTPHLTCVECNAQFEPYKSARSFQKFCTNKCRNDFHNKIKREKIKFASLKGFKE